MKAPKILFFVDGMAPTPDDMAAAAEITGQICFRNARVIPAEGALEECDGVAGHIPAPYKKLPSAAQAIKAHAAKIKALAGKVGDAPAPSEPAAPAVPPATGEGEPQGDAGTGEPATDPANAVAPGAAPAGAAGAAWKSN
ncbi:hypothetical protein QAY89_gp32 [Xanthomonas phage Langgrundblatt1]|uniref:Uncharacterized protein n=1 Tax=Xanthomonas phage Langgrundblatt1 TaxID=2939128 RepID=A0A9E7E171_9CAUD|nr:hypothetical protein QAY89_gp32 [Xanthomonas phage Langgrundblatt1]URA06797.1 hypothetical protein Langgrundblatt1_BL10032 [Xanthomonas phage Langgrundblatt1]